MIVGPFVCKPNDAAPYDGCQGALTNCSGAFDCWRVNGDASGTLGDTGGSEICAQTCVVGSDCGNPGVACCYPANSTCEDDLPPCSGGGTFGLTADVGACLPCD